MQLLNAFGYQEAMPVQQGHQPVQKHKETCMLCADARPFGCDPCRNEVKQADKRVYIGGGEVMPQWC